MGLRGHWSLPGLPLPLLLNRNPNQAYDKLTLGAKCVKADPNPNPPALTPTLTLSLAPNPNPSRCVKGDPVDMSNALQRQLRKVRVRVGLRVRVWVRVGVGSRRQLRKQGKD